METLELVAEPRRDVKKGVKDLRNQGLVPAVVYGKDVASTPLQVEAKDLDKVLTIAGTHQLISLKVGKQKPQMALARDIQRDVIKRNCLHVDFYAVKMDQKVTAQVPLILEGASPAVNDFGGVLTQGLNQLEVECLPADLLSSITVNIESLAELHSSISVADLVVPDTITILSELESMVVRVEPPRTSEAVDEAGESIEDEAAVVDEVDEEATEDEAAVEETE